MNDQVMKGVVMGLAAGGLTSAVIAINKTVLQTLWRLNYLAAEIVGTMALVTIEWVKPEDDDDDACKKQ